MNLAQHTKGPWRLTHGSRHDGDRYVMSASSRIIVSVDGGPNDDSEMFANARLIAAAPELLEALQGCEAALREAGKDFALSSPLAARPNLYEIHAEVARAAIAKAKGGAT